MYWMASRTVARFNSLSLLGISDDITDIQLDTKEDAMLSLLAAEPEHDWMFEEDFVVEEQMSLDVVVDSFIIGDVRCCFFVFFFVFLPTATTVATTAAAARAS
mmetsp:Transcript_31114/g.46915  ORF Transcript_31114/g.46915 Transcript_31114/m.46915 type:complete len:103 (+) Transcript_31114:1967-2275(+)